MPPQPDFDTKTSFDVNKFYAQILPNTDTSEDLADSSMAQGLAKFDTLEEKLRKLEMPKRTSFTHKFELDENLVISVKGYRTVVDQKYFPYVTVAENKHGELEQTEKESKVQNDVGVLVFLCAATDLSPAAHWRDCRTLRNRPWFHYR